MVDFKSKMLNEFMTKEHLLKTKTLREEDKGNSAQLFNICVLDFGSWDKDFQVF